MNHSKWHHGLALGAYTVIALIYSWPLALHVTTHMPGSGDAPWFIWQFWWFKYALFDLHQLPYTTNLLYYPLQDVPVMAQTPVNETLMLPLLVGTNLILFYNLLFYLTYILSGYFTYLLGRALRCRPAIAFVGGLLFAFCAYRGMRGLGHLSLLTTQWMPLTLLLALQCWRKPSPARGAALGIATALVALSSPYYIGLFLLPVLFVGGLVIVFMHWRRLLRWPLWQAGGIAALVAAVLVLPPYAHYLFLDADIYTITGELGQQAVTNSADLLSWFLPSGMNALWGTYTAPMYANFATQNLMETTLFVGFIPLLLFFVSWCIDRPAALLRFWQILALLTLILSLGPTLHVNGESLWAPLPYYWLLRLPGFDSFRIPSRAGITTALAFSVIAMLLAERLRASRASSWRWSWGLGLFALVYLVNVTPFYPHPLTDMRVPAIYDAVADMAEGSALLELPAGENFSNGYNFFANVSLWMSYQRVHQRPTISGYLGRRPARLREPEETMPFIRRFFNDNPGEIAVDQPLLDQLPDDEWPADVQQAATILADQGIGAVALHCLPGNDNDNGFCQAAIDLLTVPLGLPIAIDGIHRLYGVLPPRYQEQDLPPHITDLTPQFDQAFGPLFYEPGRRGRRLAQSGTMTIAVPVAGVWAIQGLFTTAQSTQVQLLVDGQPVEPTIDRYTATTYGWRLDARWASGLHTITIDLPTAADQPQPTELDCPRLCLYNLSIRLIEPVGLAAESERAAATLIDDQGLQATLLTATRFTTPATSSITTSTQSAPMSWLVTTWQLDETLQGALMTNAPMPMLFVHLTDATGALLGQADHMLGKQHLRFPERGLLVDVAPIPPLTTDEALYTTVGLWYPATAQYFWQPAPTNPTDPAYVQLGPLPNVTLPD